MISTYVGSTVCLVYRVSLFNCTSLCTNLPTNISVAHDYIMESTLSNCGISPAESQKLLDHEIEINLAKFASHLADVEKCREAVRVLRSKRNQTAPISNLPLEIICNIFLFLQIDEEHDWRRWIYLTHVNRHWRDIVFAFPALWNYSPPLALPHWVDEVLRRYPDKVSNFVLNVDMDCRPSVRGLRKILRHSSEIKSLSITNMQYEHEFRIMGPGRLPKFAPHLQALCISSPIGSGAQDTLLDNQFLIPDSVLAAAAKLRRLELSECRVNWDSYILPHITHLKLHDLSDIDKPTFSKFMEALGKVTDLQHLDLKNAFPVNKSIEEEGSPSARVTFSCLQCLDVSGTVLQVRDFFTGITVPTSTKTTVKVRLVDGPNLRFLPALSSIAVARSRAARLLPDPDSCAIRTIIMDQPTNLRKGVRLLLLTDAFDGPDDALAAYQNAANVVLLLEWEEISPSTLRTTVANQTIADVFKCGLSLGEVSHLHLDASDIQPVTLIKTIGVLPAVSFVKVEGSIAKPFIDAFHPIQIRRAHPSKLYFSSLQSIRIEDCAFGSHSIELPSFRLLQDSLQTRSERGAAISKLVLLDCENLTKEEVDELRDVVGDVEWDGIIEDWHPGLEDVDEVEGSAEEIEYSSSGDSEDEDDEGGQSSTDSEDGELSTSGSEASDNDPSL